MPFEMNLIGLLIVFVLAYFLGWKFRRWIPLGKEFKVGSFNAVGILIIFMTIDSFFPSHRSNFYYAISFGLVLGFASNITSYGRKRNSRFWL
ncbi:hypothetical protein [Desulfitobacterium sp.]|uniref:hypothetical protein n=1 Tax=Desulfitobacterium sp. TaxID=49981 RepID=UPI002C4FAD1A|nr:hypothetical protein [Desulfitobacterium sp.]HVJ49731.1 hypothetical protein [Desulfitobacterium sp.]